MEATCEINWNSFKAKFDGKEQKEFERLSYILFCLEYGQKFGIFRYKNQAGIETNPIEKDGIITGFQTKFYETKISENETDIKDSIQKAKNKNPNLNKILFYLNKELSESSDENKQKPQYQENIEKYAQNLGIELDWRVPSHFERQLIEPDKRWLWEIFFSPNKGLLDFVNEVECHSKRNLEAIRTEIIFGEQRIKINRTSTINEIKNNLSIATSIVVTGSGGTGKTALIKDLSDSLECPLFVFKAFEFSNKTSVNDLFPSLGSYTFNDFMSTYKDLGLKVVVIDSAEKLSDIENRDVFKTFTKSLLKDNWKIIFTTREMYLNDLTFELENSYQIGFSLMSIPILTEDELLKIAQEHSFELPSNEKLKELLAIPFYLSKYLTSYTSNEISLKDFKTGLWNSQIMNSCFKKNNIHTRREKEFRNIVEKKVLEGNFLVRINDPDNEALSALCEDEIIKYDEKQYAYFITHDIYEEWGLEKFIDYKYTAKSSYEGFIESIGSSLPIRRAFRNWLSDRLFDNDGDIKELKRK